MKTNIIVPFGKNQDLRGKYFKNYSIHSRSNQFDVTILGDGPREEWCDSNWTWINLGDHHWSKKVTIAIKDKLLPENYDFYLFCDNDAIINVDGMVNDCNVDNNVNQPCMWTGFPGHPWHPDIDIKHFNKFISECRICNSNLDCHVAQCCTVVNNSFLKLAHKSCVPNTLYKIQNETYFDIDVCPSVIGCALGVQGRKLQNAEARPYILNHANIVAGKKMWHVHHIFDNPIMDYIKLEEFMSLKKPTSVTEAISGIFKDIETGFKAKKLYDKKFKIGYYWCPWNRWINGWHDSDQSIEFLKEEVIVRDTKTNNIVDKGSLIATEGGALVCFENKIQMHIKHSYKGDALFTYQSDLHPDIFVGNIMRMIET